jgi:type IV secretory pathway protease TraF
MQQMELATKKQEEEEHGKKVKVDGMEVKVKTPPPRKGRPVYHCQTCNTSFPSQLDLEEHKKIDHNNNKKDRVAV